MNNYNYTVATRCMTYNHVRYIDDTLNGFVNQQTSFPVVFAVVDDASNDGEQELLISWVEKNLQQTGNSLWKELPYGRLAVSSLKENANHTFVVLLLSENHYQAKKTVLKTDYISEWFKRAKYHAICEGDDYWTDPHKLQKQVDYMEKNEKCMLTGGLCIKLFQDDNRIEEPSFCVNNNTNFKTILFNAGIGAATCTVMYRNANLEEYHVLLKEQKWLMSDFPLYLCCSFHGDIYIFNEIFAVYRILNESASHTKSYDKARLFKESIGKIQLYFSERYAPELMEEIRDSYNRRMFLTAISFCNNQDVNKYYKAISKPSLMDVCRYLRYKVISVLRK